MNDASNPDSTEAVGGTNAGSPHLLTGPLKVHLSVLIILLLIGIAGPLIWLAYQRGQAAAVESATEQMTGLTERTMDRYRILFADAVPIMNLLSVSETFANDRPVAVDDKKRLLIEALGQSPYLDGVYCAFPDGSFVHIVSLQNSEAWRTVLAAPPAAVFALRLINRGIKARRSSQWFFLDEGGNTLAASPIITAEYDPRVRPWYQLASTVPGLIAVGPYVTATTKSLAVTIAKAHVKDGRIVIGTDILLDTIKRFLSQEKVSPRGRAYILDGSGAVLIRSDLDGHLPDAEAKDPVLEAARNAIGTATGDAVTLVEFKLDGENFLASSSRIKFSPLLQGNSLVVAAPLSDFTAASDRLLRQGLIVSLVLLLAGILVAVLVARFITHSLSALTNQAASLGDLEFANEPAPTSYVREINLLSGALAVAREAIRTFALYVPRELVRKIIASNPGVASSGGRSDVTVVFTDIRDFTTICEQHSPEKIVAWLSDYFELMNEAVEEHHGTIIQFLGDSIYAMWNAPVSDPDHVDHACRCALSLAERIARFNARRQGRGKAAFVTRFGIHTGPAVVGSVGARSRLQYTAMGDTVNVASRLEGINKEYGTTIIVSKSVWQRVSDRFEFRPLGMKQAKGRKEQIEIFELCGAVSAVGTDETKG